jgi:hypothetical protein
LAGGGIDAAALIVETPSSDFRRAFPAWTNQRPCRPRFRAFVEEAVNAAVSAVDRLSIDWVGRDAARA